ncbi:hypothetical protein LOZ58_000383 [Ophidiomyces ophidiicola]|nr:hypothetical protein LOZ58_000383 [Ophidiomyces ophidiicola]
MGGKVFSQPKGDLPALHTPRMSEAVHSHLRDFCIEQLRLCFEDVVAPAEAPEKVDYGDVDTLVSKPLPGFSWDEVAGLLKAHRTEKFGESRCFAVPISLDNNDNGETPYAQVDVHICHPGFIEWECLLDAYGDMWQIVGKFLRPLGLTATDKGLHIRIEEIEPKNRAYSKIYLTHNVNDVLDFLGLDLKQYQEGFETMDQLYRWCSSGKFFHPSAFKFTYETANDRQRYKKRIMFQTFVDKWLPEHAGLWHGREPMTRETVVEHALIRFDKREEYDKIISTWRLKIKEEELWNEISTALSEEYSGDIALILRGFKRWVQFPTEEVKNSDQLPNPSLRETAEMEVDRQPRWVSQISSENSKAHVFNWVRQVWPQVRTLEKERIKAAKAARP